MAELSSIQTASKFNQVYHLQKPDYSRDVTDTSKEAWVLVLLTAATTNTESQRAVELWRELARKFGDIKFCQIRANMCIEGYPDKNTPTILVYKDGDIKRQIVTLKELNGPRTWVEGKILTLIDAKPCAKLPDELGISPLHTYLFANGFWLDVEKLLIDLGALKHGDPRLRRKDEEDNESSKKIRQTRVEDDEDSDWD